MERMTTTEAAKLGLADQIKGEISFDHDFKGFGIHESKCHVDIFTLQDDRKVVLLSDLAIGTSVTNACEQIATEVRRLHDLDPATTLWAETYPEDNMKKNHVTGKMLGQEFDQIFFNYNMATDEYSSPDWKRVKNNLLMS